MDESKRLFISKVVFLIALVASIRLFVSVKVYQSIPIVALLIVLYFFCIAKSLHSGTSITKQGTYNIEKDSSSYWSHMSFVIFIYSAICLGIIFTDLNS